MIDYNESASAHEVAREIINKTIDPIIELEKKGVLKNARVVLFGGTVTKPQRPRDYDLLVMYDEALKPGEKDDFSDGTKTTLWRLFPEKGKTNENVAYGLDVHRTDYHSSSPKGVHPNYVEVWLRSTKSYLASLDETPEQIRKRAFLKLFDLPDAVAPIYEPLDGFIDPEYQEKWRQPAIALCLILAREFNNPLSKEDLLHIGGPNKDISVFHSIVNPTNLLDIPEGNTEFDKRIEKFILESHRALKIPYNELADFLSARMNTQQRRNFVKTVVNQFTESTTSDISGRVSWIYEGLLRSENPEMGAVETELLIKGENIELNDSPLFKEDKSFLKQ